MPTLTLAPGQVHSMLSFMVITSYPCVAYRQSKLSEAYIRKRIGIGHVNEAPTLHYFGHTQTHLVNDTI